jgi:hypothetical protein
MPSTMSMRRSRKRMWRLSSILIVGLSAAVGCVPRPDTGPAASPHSVASHPDMTGWRPLGDTWITGQFEHAIVRIGKHDGRIARVMLVVMESNVEVSDVVVQFGNGQRWSPGLRHSFGDGSRSRAIDLPGHVRFIRALELVHGSVPPGGRAHAEVWGQ